MTNSYVLLYSLDFSKVIDTVCHTTLFEKPATFKIPDQVYNWVANFYTGRSHCTLHGDIVSELLEIFASVIQGSALSPYAYAVNIADIRPIDIFYFTIKFADDTGLIVGARQLETGTRELNNIKEWALRNNLCLNESKSVETVFVNKKRKLAFETPPSLNEIPRKHTTKLLRRFFNECAYHRRHFVLRTSNVWSADVETLWIEPIINLCHFPIRHISKANLCCNSMDWFR